ncbi:DUF4190 domain-containing protein [Mycobacterium sp.]|uniref:DUF4190 domain-containing protein n=1 Tax=Mycobacterium sp. TaxID=1785 RepID=UPI003BAEA584
MTAPGGDHGEEYRAHEDQPRPWEQYPHPPVDPQAPVDYPEYPPRYPPQPPAGPPYGYPPQPPAGPPYGGYPPAPPGGPIGYGGPPAYPGPYDPYQAYQASPYQTNGLAVTSLVSSIVGALSSFMCLIGVPITIVGIVVGVVALNQVKRTNQQGRGLAIAGIAIGAAALTLEFIAFVALTSSVHSPMFVH